MENLYDDIIMPTVLFGTAPCPCEISRTCPIWVSRNPFTQVRGGHRVGRATRVREARHRVRSGTASVPRPGPTRQATLRVLYLWCVSCSKVPYDLRWLLVLECYRASQPPQWGGEHASAVISTAGATCDARKRAAFLFHFCTVLCSRR